MHRKRPVSIRNFPRDGFVELKPRLRICRGSESKNRKVFEPLGNLAAGRRLISLILDALREVGERQRRSGLSACCYRDAGNRTRGNQTIADGVANEIVNECPMPE